VLRCANVLGPDIDSSHTRLLALPAVPMILGFDPRYQFVHSDDVVHALEHAVLFQVPGTFNVAGEGVLVFSEVISLLGKFPLPVLPPWGTGLLAAPIRKLGVQIPPEMLQQLRFGRGIDNRLYRSTGFDYQYSTRETVIWLANELRLKPVISRIREPYRYEREVEDFLRLSPNVLAAKTGGKVGREDAAMFDPSPPVE
jgi:UDP-glucose 4-epimerase